MVIKQIRLSTKAKDSLVKLKAKTGIQNWNVLCRWAFCYSIREGTVPLDLPMNTVSNVEMSWETFGGEYAFLYDALIMNWCRDHNISTNKDSLAKYFRLHLERGISHLAGTGLIRSLDDLVDKAMEAI